MGKKSHNRSSIGNERKEVKQSINSGLDRIERRVAALEASDAQNAMDIRNLQIQMRVMRGEKQTDLAREYALSEGRISQIAKS